MLLGYWRPAGEVTLPPWGVPGCQWVSPWMCQLLLWVSGRAAPGPPRICLYAILQSGQTMMRHALVDVFMETFEDSSEVCYSLLSICNFTSSPRRFAQMIATWGVGGR